MNWRPSPAALFLAAVVSAQGAAAPAPAFTVAGQVVDVQKKPVAGAMVALWERLGHTDARFLVKGTTDTEGRFDLAVHRELAATREHPFGTVTVVVTGTTIRRTWSGRLRAGTRDAEIMARPAVRFEGLVLDSKGNPVPAAVVSGSEDGRMWEATTTNETGWFVLPLQPGLLTVMGEGFVMRVVSKRIVMPEVTRLALRIVDESGKGIGGASIEHEGRVVTITDSDGRFSVPTASGPGALPHRYWLNTAGYESAAILLDQQSEQRVASAEPLRGRVVDGEGKAVDGARVSMGPRLAAWTDRHGMFRFDSLPRAVVRLEAAKQGYRTARVTMDVGTAADRVTLRLIRGVECSGRVLHGGKAVMGARVVASTQDGVELAYAYSDDRGRFFLRGVPPAAVRLHASMSPLVSARVAHRPGVTLDLEDTMRLFGIVVDDSGRPLGATRVRMGKREVKTDAQGRFDFGQVPVAGHGDPIRVVGFRTPSLPRWAHHPGERRRVIALTKLGDIKLHFVPVPMLGFRPRITIRRREEPRIRRSNQPGSDFRDLPPGTYDVTIQAAGYLEYRETIRVQKSMILRPVLRHGGVLHLKASAGAKVIVQTLSGKPAPIVVLELATGIKSVRGFGPGNYRFIARAKGELIVVKQVKLGPNAPPVHLDLRGAKESRLLVTVLDSAGDPVVGAKVVISKSDFDAPPRRTDENGVAVLTRLFAGRIRVSASHGERAAVRELDVAPGKELALQLTLN